MGEEFLPLHVFVGVGFEGFLASGCAEVVGFPHVGRRILRGCLVDGHSADRVFRHSFTSINLVAGLDVGSPEQVGVGDDGDGADGHRDLC